MYNQSINRLRPSRGKTPPGCWATGFIHAWHERMIRSIITDDVMLGYLITRTQYFDRWRIDVKESQEWLLKMVGRLSRFAMHPLPPERNTVELLANRSITPFQNETAKNLQILGLVPLLSLSASSK